MAILSPAIKTPVAATVKKVVKPVTTSTAPVSATPAVTGAVNYSTANPAARQQVIQNQARIANDPSYVQSETQRALNVIAQRQAQGMDVSAQQKYLQKNLGYQGIIPAATSAPTNQLQNYVPITSQQQQNANQAQALFGQAQQTLNAPNADQTALQQLMQQYVTQQYTPFSYDRNTDPNYQAGLAATQRNIQSGTNQTMAELNRRGILNSTITGDRASQIAADAYGQLETQLLPQYYAQAQQMWMNEQNAKNQQFQNQYNLANMYDTQRQNQFTNQRGLATDYNNLAQQDFQNRLSTADRTGNLQTADMETAIQNIQALKQLASAPGITKEQRDAYSKQADVYRAQIDAMGGDSSLFGKNVTAAQTAQRAQAGVRTLQGQQLDLQNRQANLNAAIDVGTLTGKVVNPQSDWTGLFRQAANPNAPLNYTAQQDAVRNAQTDRSLTETERANRAGEQYNNDRLAFDKDTWTQEFANAKYEFGEELAIKKMAQILDRDQLEEVIRSNLANEGMDQQQIDQRWAEIDAGLSGSGGTYDGLSQSQIIDTIKEQFSRDTPVYDKYGDQTGTERKYPQNKDAATKEAIYQSVLAYGLPDAQETQTLLALGLTQQDIADLDKKYADASSAVPSGPGAGGSGSKPNTAMQASFKPGSGGGLTFSNGTSGYNNYYKAQKFVGTNNFNKNGAAIAQALQDGGYPSSWLAPTLELVARESAFSHTAKNPKSTARGLFQFLDGTRKNYGGSKVDWSDPYQQSIKGLQYIKDRYGDPVKALKFWDKNNYY